MTCCKSTSTGVGIPSTTPSNNEPDIYIEQPSGQIWVWNGTKWVMPPVGAVSYNSTTRVLTVGASSVTLPIASTTEYGVVKLADPTTDPTNPIEANSDGTLTINCAKLIAHCNLATKSYVDSAIGSAVGGISGAAIVSILMAMSKTDLAGLACKLKSDDAGNLLQCRADGLYYGITPPANLQNQFVDPVNGDDSNSGTRASPLRNLVTAINRLPSGTEAVIHLEESAMHYFKSSQRVTLDKNINLFTYGPLTDAAHAEWDAQLSGWAWHGWKDAPKANIAFVFDDLRGIAEPNKMLGMCIRVQEGHVFHPIGINFITPNQTNVTAINFWQGSISGQGKVLFTDCSMDTAKWPLLTSSPDYSPTISLDVVDATGAGPVFDLGSGGRMIVDVYTRPAGTLNPQGYVYNEGATKAYYAGKVVNRETAVPTSPNFNANF